MKLDEQIQSQKRELEPFFGITDGRWDNLMLRLQKELKPQQDYYDEVVWTFLLSLAFVSDGAAGVNALYQALTGTAEKIETSNAIRLEALPIPPRIMEGNTNIDLALGAISERSGTPGGIDYDIQKGKSIVFCEMKWYSDISTKVTHDQTRNQLSRIIENAMTFQTNGKFPEKVTVTLVTPQLFVGQAIKSRLYQYKFEEYKNSPKSLIDEWRASHHLMKPRNSEDPRSSFPDWTYPEEEELRDRLMHGFEIKHISFEELFEKAPDTPLTASIRAFVAEHNHATNRFGQLAPA
ncbi:MAG: hypothetical protein P1U87_18045 [Verrucomicrobiales bacterium]|nr:hypothetical protein [Verrucomicrobiales bacterium]